MGFHPLERGIILAVYALGWLVYRPSIGSYWISLGLHLGWCCCLGGQAIAKPPTPGRMAFLAVYYWTFTHLNAAVSSAAPAALLLSHLAFLAGWGLKITARVQLGAQHAGRISASASPVLVRSGVYRLSRHPIYLGSLLHQCGSYSLNVTASTSIVFGGFVALLLSKISKEEVARLVASVALESPQAFLAATFGEEYEAYKQKTPMLISVL